MCVCKFFILLILSICMSQLESSVNVSVEYMFKFGNETQYGLLKDDLNRNGVACIIRLSPVDFVNLDETKLDSNARSFFTIKKFLPGFYMLRLAADIQTLFQTTLTNFFSINLTVENELIPLKFQLVKLSQLQLKFAENQSSAEMFVKTMQIYEEYGVRQNLYGGPILYQAQLDLHNSLIQNYPREFIHFTLVNSTLASNSVKLDQTTGVLRISPGFYIDREKHETLNFTFSLTDSRKLFKPAFLSLTIQILDLNDNKPLFKYDSYNVTIGQSAWANDKMILVFDEAPLDLDNNFKIELNLGSSEFSRVEFEIIDSKLWMKRKITEETKESELYALELVCKDNGEQTSSVKINLVVKLTDLDEKRTVLGEFKSSNNSSVNEEISGSVFFTQNASFYDVDLTRDFSVDKRAEAKNCSVNKIKLENNVYIQHLTIYNGRLQLIFNPAFSLNEALIECHLRIENGLKKLNFYLRFSQSVKFKSKNVKFNLTKKVFESTLSFVGILPVEQFFPETIGVFRILNDSSNGLIEIDAFNGVLRTSRFLNTPHKTADFLKLKIKADFYSLSENGVSLTNSDECDVDLIVDDSKLKETEFATLLRLESISAQLNLTKLNVTIKTLDEVDQKIVLNLNESNFNFKIERVYEIDVETGFKAESSRFKIDNFQLIHNSSREKMRKNCQNLIYWVGLELCAEKNCRQVEFLVEVKFDLNLDQIKFDRDETRIQLKNIIDFKTYLKHFNSLNFVALKQLIRFKLKIDDDKIRNFLFDELNGVLFMPEDSAFLATVIVETLTGEKLTESVFKLAKIPQIVQNSVRVEVFLNHFDTINIFSFNSIFDKFEIICVDLSQRKCNEIFKVNNGFLTLNRTSTLKNFDFLNKNRTVQLKLKSKSKLVHEIDVGLIFSLSSRLRMEDWRVRVLRGDGPWWLKLDNVGKIERVWNLLKNAESFRIEYRLENENFFISNVGFNQVYSIDFSNLSSRFYLIKFDGLIRTKKIEVELSYEEIFNDACFVTSLRSEMEILNDLKPVYLMNQIQTETEFNSFLEIYDENLVFGKKWSELFGDLRSTQIYGGSIKVNVYKIYVEKISLTISQVENLEISLTLTNQNRNVHQMDVFYYDVKLRKSELSNHGSFVDALGYDVLVHDFNRSGLVLNDLSLPVRLADNGELLFSVSEMDFFDDDLIKIEICDQDHVVRVDLSLVEDEPILASENFLVEFRIEDRIERNLFVGFIDLVGELKRRGELKSEPCEANLSYEIKQENGEFFVDEKSGALFLMSDLGREENATRVLRVEVNGELDSRPVKVFMVVAVRVEKSKETPHVVCDEVNFRVNDEQLKSGVSLTALGKNETLFFTPFVETSLCEVSLYGGEILCQSTNTEINLPVVAYQPNPPLLKYIKVNILRSENDVQNQEPFESSVELEVSRSSRPGTVLAKLAQLNPELNEAKFLLSQNPASSSFALTSSSGDLILVGPLPSQKRIQLDVNAFKLNNLQQLQKVGRIRVVISITDNNNNNAEINKTISELEIDELNEFEIDIPFGDWLNMGKNKLYQIKAKNAAYFECEEKSSDLLSLDPSTGWIYFDVKLEQTKTNKLITEEIKIVAVSQTTPRVKSSAIRARFNLIPLKKPMSLEINSAPSSAGLVLIDLKQTFPNSYPHLAIQTQHSPRCQNCLKYDPIKGHVFIAKQFTSPRYEFLIKLKNNESDFFLAVVKVVGSTSVTREIFLSKNLGVNSVIFTADEKISSSSESLYFSIDPAGLKIILSSSLGDLSEASLELQLDQFTLRVYLIENYLETIDFEKKFYTFYSNETTNTARIRLNSFSNDLVLIDSAKVNQTRCDTDPHFKIEKNELVLTLNNQAQFCSIEINALVKSKNWSKLISTKVVVVKLFNDEKDLFLTKFPGVKSVYTVTAFDFKNFLSIDLYGLINFSRSDNFYFNLNTNLLDKEIDVDFNQVNGLVLIRSKNQKLKQVNFLISIHASTSRQVLHYFELRLLISAVFKQKWLKINKLITQIDAFKDERHFILNVNDLLNEPIDSLNVRLFNSDGFSLEGRNLFFNMNLTRRFFVNFTKLLTVEACREECEQMLVEVRLSFARLSFVEYAIEFYSFYPLRLRKNEARLKLKSFNEKKSTYELNESCDDELSLNESVWLGRSGKRVQCEKASLWLGENNQLPVGFESDAAETKCQDDIRSKNCHFALGLLRITQHKRIRLLFTQKPSQKKLTNFTIEFMASNTTTSMNLRDEGFALIKSKSWSLKLNGSRISLEFNYNEIAWANIVAGRREHLSFEIADNFLKFKFNNELKEFKVDDLSLFKMEGNFLIDNSGLVNNEILIESVWLNKERLGLFDSESKSFLTRAVLNEAEYEIKEAPTRNVHVLIVVVLAASVSLVTFSFVGLLALFICVRNKRKSGAGKNEKSKKSKFNSRNQLEISVNSSQNCSSTPSSSSSSSFSGVTVTQSLSRHTVHSGYTAVKTCASTSSSGIVADASKLGTYKSNEIGLSYETPALSFGADAGFKCKNNCEFFTANEFDLIKHTLNWTPSYGQFKMVIGDFEQFARPNNQYEANAYNDYDRQTFV